MWWREKTSWSIKLKPKVHIFSPCTNFYDCQQKNCCGFRDSEVIPINNLFLLSRAILFMSCPFSSSSCFRWCVCNFRGCQKSTKRPTLTFKKIQHDSLSENIFSTYQGSMFTSMLLSRWFCSPSSTWQWLVLLPGRGLLLQPQCQGFTISLFSSLSELHWREDN